MKLLTVNKTLEQLDTLDNQPVRIQGVLTFEFENISISHYPQAEYQDFTRSSIWIDLSFSVLGFDKRVMSKLHCKRVVIEGILRKPDALFGGAGHMCLWSASVLATEIELWKNISH